MKLNKFIILIILSFFINIDIAYCLNGIVNGTEINVRAGAGTTYESIGKVNLKEIYKLLDENKIEPTDNTNENCSYWYKISYNNKEAYICSIYLTLAPSGEIEGGTGDFENDLKKFPESYQKAIKELHTLYPNATFTVLNTGLEWNNVVNNENYIAGGNEKNIVRSLIQTKYDGYKSTNKIVYNFKTNTWNTNISGGGTSWYAAHEDVISYYLDPRNFLTYNSIFMFLNHGYSENITYKETAINDILKGSFMENAMTNDKTHTFAKAFIDAGKESGISPYYLATRVIQEIGKSKTRSSYVDGVYNGYYNYYNIGATGSNNLINALATAKEEKWENDYAAIIGGAKFISNGYVKTGQTTLYLEKWDVVDGGNGYYSHQYMQNVEAIVTEANTLYNAYIKNSLTSTNMEFLIPVYKVMPEKTSLPNKGNPNNYLSNIKINGYIINNYDIEKLTYTYNISSITEQIEIDATKIAPTSTIKGIGTIKITNELFKDNEYTHTISVTAENGNIKKYTIKFTKDDEKPIPISDIVNYKGYVSDGTHISGINVGTTCEDIIKNIKSAKETISVKITDINDKEKTGIIATGDKITINNGNETKTYIVIIYGDINGDGKITSTDYVYVKNSIMGTKNLNEREKIAGDINKDGKITSSDYVFIKNHIMGTKLIKQ